VVGGWGYVRRGVAPTGADEVLDQVLVDVSAQQADDLAFGEDDSAEDVEAG
jgi:hypothetical protein